MSVVTRESGTRCARDQFRGRHRPLRHRCRRRRRDADPKVAISQPTNTSVVDKRQGGGDRFGVYSCVNCVIRATNQFVRHKFHQTCDQDLGSLDGR